MPTSVISSAQSQVTLRRVVKAGRSGAVQRPLFANCVAYAAMGFNKQQISTGMSTRSQVVMTAAAAADTSGVENTAAYGSYETMVVLRPDLSDEQRDSELAKFEAFLRKHGAAKIDVTVRGRQRLAYPMKGFSDGIYVLYTFEADPSVVSPMQKMLSTPTAGAELNVLRHISFRV